MQTKIVILGNHRHALTVARQLADHYTIILGGAHGRGGVERSRFVSEVWDLPKLSNPLYISELEDKLANTSFEPLLFPVGDAEISTLLESPSVARGKVKVVMPQPDTARRCLDKGATINLANQLQVPQAKYRKVTSLDDVATAVRETGYPSIIKSDNQLSLAFGKKACYVYSESELAELLASASELEHGLIVQAVATGLRHNVYFAAEHGRLIGAVESRVLRTDIFDGSGFTVESESVPLNNDLHRYTAQLIRELSYHGIGHAQFLVDQNYEKVSFLEVNPRMGAAFAVTVPCGFNFARAGVNLAVGSPVAGADVPEHYPAGQRLAWSYGDFIGLLRAIRGREIGPIDTLRWIARALRSAMLSDIHSSWSLRDPKPALANLYLPLQRVWRRATGHQGGLKPSPAEQKITRG